LGATPRIERIGAVTVAENVDRSLASVTCRLAKDEAFTAAAHALFGVRPPDPGRWTEGSEYSLIWTGPGQWFVQAAFSNHEDIAARLSAGLGGSASVTEQTDAWAQFDLSGPDMPSVLERLTSADTRRMDRGAATRTIIEHIGCFVICRAAATSFTVMGPRSYAGSLQHALLAAAHSVA
jgi:sarcosine oxidase subunit gamma